MTTEQLKAELEEAGSRADLHEIEARSLLSDIDQDMTPEQVAATSIEISAHALLAISSRFKVATLFLLAAMDDDEGEA